MTAIGVELGVKSAGQVESENFGASLCLPKLGCSMVKMSHVYKYDRSGRDYTWPLKSFRRREAFESI